MRRVIKPVYQPDGSNCCGQACVAMVAGVSLDEAKRAVGKSGTTCGPDLVRGLRNLGASCADKVERLKDYIDVLAGLAIVKVHYPNSKKRHWIVIDRSRVYDPAGEKTYSEAVSDGSKWTSFLRIIEQE